MKSFVMLAIYTGMRSRSEILALKWDQVDLDARLIRILDTKSQEEQTVIIPDALYAYLVNAPRRSEYVVSDYKGRQVKDIKNGFKALLKFEGLDGKGYTPHTLRHTFASHMVMSGASIPVVKECLRHADISTTMRYAHLSDQHKKDSVNKLEEVFH